MFFLYYFFLFVVSADDNSRSFEFAGSNKKQKTVLKNKHKIMILLFVDDL